jgi:hypothetical protein
MELGFEDLGKVSWGSDIQNEILPVWRKNE